MNRKSKTGFTLIELLIVIAIFAVFALMAYGGLDTVLRTRRDVEAGLDRTAEFQKAYMRLRNDFQQVRDRPARDGYGDEQPPLRMDTTSGNARVEFTRGGWRNPLYQPRATLERVSYRLDGKKLLRESWRVLDQAQDSKVVSLLLLDDVDEIKWQFLDSQREWKDGWPQDNADAGAAGASPPLAVQVTMTTKRMGELNFVFRVGLDQAKIAGSAAGANGLGDGVQTVKPPPRQTEPPPPQDPIVDDTQGGDQQ